MLGFASAPAGGPPPRLSYTATLLALLPPGSAGPEAEPGLLLSAPDGELEEISLCRYHRVEVRREIGIFTGHAAH